MKRTFNNKGFALVITLSLTAFLVLILVGLAAFTQVETSIASTTQVQAQARQNALFALDQAVGMLQTHLGRDDRVTARGDLQNPPLAATPASQGTQYWVGVYDPADPSPTATALTWLVSENSASRPLNSEPGNGARPVPAENNDTDYAMLVNASGPIPVNDKVRLLKSEIKTTGLPGFAEGVEATVGRYAFWIGDESTKAPVSGSDDVEFVTYRDRVLATRDYTVPGSNPPLAQERLRHGIFQAPRIDLIFQDFTTDTIPAWASTIESATAARRSVLSSNELIGLAAAGDKAAVKSAIAVGYHDISREKYAVIASTLPDTAGERLGGLKWDIDRFDPSATGFSASAPQTGSIRPPDVADANFRTALIAGTSGLLSGAFMSPPRELDGSPANLDVKDGRFVDSIMPVLVEYEVQFIFGYDGLDVTLNGMNYSYKLWNPYNVLIRAPSGANLGLYPDGFQTVRLERPASAESDLYDLQAAIPTISTGNLDDTLSADLDMPAGSLVKRTKSVALPAIKLTKAGAGLTGVPTNLALPALRTITLRLAYNGTESFRAESIQLPSGLSTLANAYFNFRLEDYADKLNWLTQFNPNSPVFTNPMGTVSYVVDVDTATRFDTSGSFLGIGGGFPGVKNDVAMLYDLRREDILSIGWLRNLPRMPNGAVDPVYNSIGARDALEANQIFDTYFISAIADVAASGASALPYAANGRYANTNLVPYWRVPTTQIRESDDLLRTGMDFRSGMTARFLMQRHPFNVNSTSVTAWRAMLGGLRRDGSAQLDQFRYSDTTGAGGDLERFAQLRNAYLRFTHTGQRAPGRLSDVFTNLFDTPSGSFSTVAHQIGIRALTEEQLDFLAERVVFHVQRTVFDADRYGANVGGARPASRPFRSLAQFLSSGILQRAIDDLDATTDEDLWVNKAPDGTLAGQVLPRNSPGTLTQADIVERLAPVLTARGDTFVVRAYGEVVDPLTYDPTTTGRDGTATKSQAWLEAVVQRFPDYVAPTTPPNVTTTSDTNDPRNNEPGDAARPRVFTGNDNPTNAAYPEWLNAQFGRRFRVVSIRWLSPSEV